MRTTCPPPRHRLKKGDLKSAQIDLRNAVRNDPQNAEAHYWLGRVTFELGDPVASEREAIAARDRGFDPHQTVPLLAQALLAQNKFERPAEHAEAGRQGPAAGRLHPGRPRLRPDRPETPGRCAEVLRRSRTGRAERGGAAAGRRPPRGRPRRPGRCAGEDRPRDRRPAEIVRGAAGQGAVAAPEERCSRRHRGAGWADHRPAQRHAGAAGPRQPGTGGRQERRRQGRHRRRC